MLKTELKCGSILANLKLCYHRFFRDLFSELPKTPECRLSFSLWASPFLLCFLAGSSSASFPRALDDVDGADSASEEKLSTTDAISSSLGVVSSSPVATDNWLLFDEVAEFSDGSWLTEAEVVLISNTR